MTNGQIFFYVALALILLNGAYSIFLAITLDKSIKIIDQQKKQIAKMVEPPF